MAYKKTMSKLFAVFLFIILGLALAPSVAAFAESAQYQMVSEDYISLVPGTSNVTATTYNIRNVTSTITVEVLDKTDNSTVDSGDYSYVVTAAKAITFDGLEDGEDYWVNVDYQTIDLSSAAVLALLPLAVLLWVVAILAVGIIAIIYVLKRT